MLEHPGFENFFSTTGTDRADGLELSGLPPPTLVSILLFAPLSRLLENHDRTPHKTPIPTQRRPRRIYSVTREQVTYFLER